MDIRTVRVWAHAALIVLASSLVIAAETPNGFAVYSKGNGYNRTLYRRDMTTAGLGAETKICNKGSIGGDIQGQISFDGTWVAFSRSLQGTLDKLGGNDYHQFECWDIYIVRVDGALPATPKRVAHGYWPSWGDDSHTSTKTLYYSTAPDGTIRAVTVSQNGALSNDRLVYDVKKKWGQYFQGFMMAGPTGQWCAARWDKKIHIAHWGSSLAGKRVGGSDGCMPAVCADGKWIINATGMCQRSDGSQRGAINGEVGPYHYGTSVDMKWLVNRTDGNSRDQNTGLDVYLFKLNATNTSLTAVKQVLITSNGSWPDIHTGAVSHDVRIGDFWAEPASITAGSSATLKWSVSNATSVTINGNAVSGASLTVSPTRTTEYTLVAQGDGGPVSQTVTVTVSSPTLTAIDISPSSATVAINGSVDFSAATLDQSGDPIEATVSWSVDGGGSISPAAGSTATFISDGTAGQFTVTAASGGVQQNASVTVTDPGALHLRVNCGANTQDVAGWERDDAYVSGGSDYTFSGTFVTTGVANAAPAGVYRSVVHMASKGTSHIYDFADVPNGTYTVRMHFSDGHGGVRRMNYTFEGVQLISDLNVADEAGGTDKVLVKDVTVTVSDNNGLQIECFGTGDSDVFEAGIEVIAHGSAVVPTKTITVSDAHTGQTYSVGQTVTIGWSAGSDVGDVVIEVTPNEGENWLLVNGESSIGRNDGNWGAYEWVIPGEIDGVSLVSPSVQLRITDYVDASVEGLSGTFAISGTGGVGTLRSGAVAGNLGVSVSGGNRMRIDVASRGDYRLMVMNVKGEVLLSRAGTGPSRAAWPDATAGTYLAVLHVGGRTLYRQIMLSR